MKFGLTNTRFTRDLDLTMPDRNELLKILPNLSEYIWSGFSTGRYIVRDIYTPPGITTDHSVQRIDLQLQYLNTRWLTTKIDLTNSEEIDDFQLEQVNFHQEIDVVLDALSLTTSSAFSLISAEFQVAQKLDAAIQAGSERGRDLYDIYLLITQSKFDRNLTKELFEKLVSRQNSSLAINQIQANEILMTSYQRAVAGIQAPDFETALEACNQLLR